MFGHIYYCKHTMVSRHKLAALSGWNPMSWEGMCCRPCHTLSSNRKNIVTYFEKVVVFFLHKEVLISFWSAQYGLLQPKFLALKQWLMNTQYQYIWKMYNVQTCFNICSYKLCAVSLKLSFFTFLVSFNYV